MPNWPNTSFSSSANLTVKEVRRESETWQGREKMRGDEREEGVMQERMSETGEKRPAV